MWPSYWPWSFQMFFLKIVFYSPCRKKTIFWKTKTKTWNKGGQVIDLWWPSYWPYSIYIYIYIHILSTLKMAHISMSGPLFLWAATCLLGGCLHVSVFLIFLIFAFFCLSFSCFPLLLCISKPKLYPSVEVRDRNMYAWGDCWRERESETCIYIYMLWSYYLGQVWAFQVLLSGPSRCYYLGQVVFSL